MQVAPNSTIGQLTLSQIEVKSVEGREILQIVLQSQKGSVIHQATVDMEFITENKLLSNCFSNLHQFRDFLCQKSSKIQARENGEIVFSLKMLAKQHKVILHAFKKQRSELQVFKMKTESFIEARISQLTKIFQKRLEQIQAKLSQNSVQVDFKNNELKKNILANFSKLQTNIRQNKQQIELKTDRIGQKLANLQESSQKVDQLKKQIDYLCQSLKEMNEVIEPLNVKVEQSLQLKVYEHTSTLALVQEKLKINDRRFGQIQNKILKIKSQLNVDSHRFDTKFIENKLVITYAIADGYRTFINSEIIPINTVTSYKIKQAKTTARNICIGVTTNAIVGLPNAYKHKEIMVYYSHDGQFCQSGEWKKGGRVINDQEVINLEVDTAKWLIKWSINEQQLQVASIPELLRTKNLYLVIFMADKNDVVQLIF